MRDRFISEIQMLKERLLALSEAALHALEKAATALAERSPEIAEEVIAGDIAIDAEEVAIEEECLRLIALYQPVASDLRFLITTLKVNNELERIADLASSIAARAMAIATIHPPAGVKIDFKPMIDAAQEMLRGAIDAFVSHRLDLAKVIILEDDVVDNLNRANLAQIRQAFALDPSAAPYLLDATSISHALERIADCTTNICEDVVYLEKGAIIRHQATVD